MTNLEIKRILDYSVEDVLLQGRNSHAHDKKDVDHRYHLRRVLRL